MPRTMKLAAIRGNKILLVFKGATRQWSLPGGKIKGKENNLECLHRELSEELPKLKTRRLKRWKRFSIQLGTEKFSVTVYFSKVKGSLVTDKEIDAAAWIKVRSFDRLPLSSNTARVLNKLVIDGYLKR